MRLIFFTDVERPNIEEITVIGLEGCIVEESLSQLRMVFTIRRSSSRHNIRLVCSMD